MLEREPSKDLAVYAIWVPELGATEKNVSGAVALVPDKRARHYWNADDSLGRAFGAVLRTPATAWDVYLLYPRGARWAAASPPKPIFWMHQLSGVTNAPHLDPDVFRDHVVGALRASRA